MTDENYSMVLMCFAVDSIPSTGRDSIFREGQMARSSVSKIAEMYRNGLAGLVAFMVMLPPMAQAANVGPPTTPKGIGTENRDWVTGPKTPNDSQPIYAITQQPDVFVTMRDGVQLWTTLYLPVLPTGGTRPPCVLLADGYGAARDLPFLPAATGLAQRGYPVVFARLRGEPPSGGTKGFYEKYGQDGYDLVEWMATQPWCNGDVATVGPSLSGTSQWLTAKEAPPHLKVVLPDDANSNVYWYLWYTGGMLPGPGRLARELLPGAEDEYPLAIMHPNFDDFWAERTIVPRDLKEIARRKIPALMTSGWDSYMLGSAKSYEWLSANADNEKSFDAQNNSDTENYRDHKKIILGPWGHTGDLYPSGTGTSILPYTGFDYEVLWLDHFLKGIDNGIEKEPSVLLYVQGPNQWRFEKSWPIPDEHRVKLYLSSTLSGTSTSVNDGSLQHSPTKAPGPVSYYYSPTSTYNAAAVTAAGRLTFDMSAYEKHGLTWTSDVLPAATEMTGYPELVFWAASTATDTDFVAEITDVSPAGGALQSLQVTRGYLNGPHSFSASHPVPLSAGVINQFRMQLYPTSYVFAAGHRIRVTLQGAAIDPTLNVGWQGPALNPNQSRVDLYQDLSHPSYVELPMIGQPTSLVMSTR